MKQKIQPNYPRSSLKMKLSVEGVFSFPDEWRTTDEANPGILGYVTRTSSIEIMSGKVFARQLTQKEKLQEQSKKKGGKKESKDPNEVVKSPQQIEQEEAQARRLEEQWNKLSEDEKFYATNEDPFKSATIRFEEKQKQIDIVGKQFVILEEHILQDGGDWIYFYKVPIVNEEQLGKLKKSKPKNLNLIDLNPVIMRAWMDLSTLKSTTQATLRCQLQQVDKTEQSPSPNLQKTYIKVKITIDKPVIGGSDSYRIGSVISDPPKPQQLPDEIRCVEDMKEQFRIALESIGMEYSSMFWKELNLNEEQKQNQIFSSSKKNDHLKRKEQFLYDFNVSGKYKILKERIKRTIVSLCEHKYKDMMRGEKSFTGISCSVKDQFYSEIYNFLVSSYSDVMDDLVEEKKQMLGQVQVPNIKTQRNNTNNHLNEYKKQTKTQRLRRILSEYEMIENYHYGEWLYARSMEESPEDFELKFKYALFCIRNKLKTINEVFPQIQIYLQHNKSDKQAQVVFILLMIASDNEEHLLKGWIILRELINQDPSHVEYLCYAHLLLNALSNSQLADKYLHLAERSQLRKNQKLANFGQHRDNPIPSEVPNINGIASFSECLSEEEKDQLWMSILDKFVNLGLIWVSEKIKSKLSNEDNLGWKKIILKTLNFEGKYEECIEKAIELYGQTKQYEILSTLINVLLKSDDHEKSQKYLKIALKSCPKEKRPEILFKLGNLYLKMEKYGNAKACIIKYLDGNQNAGGLSWHYLGLAEYNCGNSPKGIECLRHANLSDPYDGSVWGLIALCYADIGNLVMVNQSLNSYEKFAVEISELRKREIENVLKQKRDGSFYDESMKRNLLERLAN